MDEISVSGLRSNLKTALKKIKEGKSIVITSRGNPIGLISPLQDEKKAARQLVNSLKKSAKIGDIVSPISSKWDAEL